ncbi:hypothetical protein evm_007272 [Chilo suppressalis]|nr:hypothetical protein evm_007272 [Chilo suppressalis]
MNTPRYCRTCFAKKAEKNITDLLLKGCNSTWSEIILFCLDIQVEENDEYSTMLCLKCYKKIILFYKFKLQVQKNDSLIKNKKTESKVKHEIFLSDVIKEEDDVENADFNYCDSLIEDTSFRAEIKQELKENNLVDCQSDDELLSVIQKIKYEFVTDENLDETKENEPIKNEKKEKKLSYGKQTTHQVCEECGKTVRNLKEHIMLHRPAHTRTRVPCKLCDKTFASHSARYRHTKVKHLGIKIPCHLCDKVVVNIKQHMMVVHESSQLQHECVSCGRRFISQSALEAHASVHTSDRPYACEHCDKRFRTKIMALQHKRQVHDKEKSHMCQYCSKSFFKKYHLQIHLRSHTKEKPYECPDCGKFFSSVTVLKNHRMLHKDTKSYNCSLCDMTFARPGYLRTHMISHTKIKKYPCKYCGVKFGRSDHRKRHEYTAHERQLISSASRTHLMQQGIQHSEASKRLICK